MPRERIIGKPRMKSFQKKPPMLHPRTTRRCQSDGYKFFEEYSLHTFPGRRYVTRRTGHSHTRQPQYLLGVIEDVTDRKLSAERIAHLAHYDALTDLSNRLFFREQLDQR